MTWIKGNRSVYCQKCGIIIPPNEWYYKEHKRKTTYCPECFQDTYRRHLIWIHNYKKRLGSTATVERRAKAFHDKYRIGEEICKYCPDRLLCVTHGNKPSMLKDDGSKRQHPYRKYRAYGVQWWNWKRYRCNKTAYRKALEKYNKEKRKHDVSKTMRKGT